MKTCVILPSVTFLLFMALPSVAEVHFPTPVDLIAAVDNYSYPADARLSRYMVIRGDNLDYLASLPLEQYCELEAVVIEFTESPEAPDELKEKKIAAIEKNLTWLINLRKCAKLKQVVLHTGEYLFIRTRDRLPYRGTDPSTRMKAGRLNLERLNERFGKKLEEILPGVIFYAHNWGW